MARLRAVSLWRQLTVVLLVLLARAHVLPSSAADMCQPAADGSAGRPDTLCGTPYCTCNQPYGRVHCSCIPNNSTIPQVSRVTIISSGACSVPQETRDLEITDCTNVTFTQNGIYSLRNLRSVQVTDVKEVVVERHGFHWNMTTSGLVVMITNATLAQLPSFAFSGYISKVVFRNTYIGLMKAFAFSSITDTERIHFSDCNFANVEPQSFKKFATNEFHIEKSRFHIVPSRFIHEVHVHKLLRMDSNYINIARTLAFQLSHPIDTVIMKNRVNVLESESFSLQVRGSVTIRDNIFEVLEPSAFRGITTDKRTSFVLPPEIQFDNNTLETFSEASLYFHRTEFTVRFTHIRFDEICSCEKLIKWREMVFPSQKKLPTPIEMHLMDLWCHLDSKKEIDYDFVSGETFYEENCTQIMSNLYFVVIVIVSAVVGLCVLIVVAILILRRRRQWDAVPTTDTHGVTLKGSEEDHKKGMVVPDGRVYRETEFHVIVEKVEPMEEPVPYRVTRDRSRSYIRESHS